MSIQFIKKAATSAAHATPAPAALALQPVAELPPKAKPANTTAPATKNHETEQPLLPSRPQRLGTPSSPIV